MSDVTLEGIAAIIREELNPVNERVGQVETRLATIEKTLGTQTTALEQLLTNKKNKDENKIVAEDRIKDLEIWAKQVSRKIGIEFEK